MSIVYRNVKGSPLTHSEVDGNFSDLDVRTAAGWRDMVCGMETRSGPSQPPLTNFRNGIYLFAFSPTDIMEGFATAHIDHDYKLGTMLYPHVHWSTTSTATGKVRWGFEYTFAQRHDDTGVKTFGPSQTVYVEQQADGEAYKHYVAESPEGQGIPGTGINVDTVILFRVFRDATHANDTFPDQAFAFTFDLHYECVRYATPHRSPNFFSG